MKLNFIGKILAAILALLFSIALAKQIVSVKVIGNSFIPSDAIVFKSSLKKGDAWSREKGNKALKILYSTGWFEDVSVEFKDGVLKYKVTELPRVTEVNYIGNSLFSDANLKEICLIGPGDTASPCSISQGIANALEAYRSRGRVAAEVKVSQESVGAGKVKLRFNIKEGPRLFIKDIQFFGNHSISSRKLESYMITRRRPFYRILGYNSFCNEAIFAQDKFAIAQLYSSLGFLTCGVQNFDVEVSPKLNSAAIKVVIDEGKKYQLGEIKVKSEVKNISTGPLAAYVRRKLRLKPDMTCNLVQINKVERDLQEKLLSQGNYDLEVKHSLGILEHGRLELVFNIRALKPIIIKQIKVLGNENTTSNLIRSSISLEEGQFYSEFQKDKSIRHLKALGLFKEVNIQTDISEECGEAVVTVSVAERKSGGAGISLSIGNQRGAGFFGNYHERNLFGENHSLLFNGHVGVASSSAKANLDLKLGKNSRLGFFLGYRSLRGSGQSGGKVSQIVKGNSDEQIKDRFKVNSGIRLANTLSRSWAHQLCTKLIRDDVGEDKFKQGQRAGAYRVIGLSSGKFLYSKVKNKLVWATEGENPTRPLKLKTSGSHTYQFDLDTNYSWHKMKGKFSARLPIREMQELYLLFDAEAGILARTTPGRGLRTQDCFTLGGEGSLRGFERHGCDPYVIDKNRAMSIGGDRYYRASCELHSSFGLPDALPVTFFAFADLGNIWRSNLIGYAVGVKNCNKLRSSLGVGISLPLGGGRMKLTKALLTNAAKEDGKEAFNVDLSMEF